MTLLQLLGLSSLTHLEITVNNHFITEHIHALAVEVFAFVLESSKAEHIKYFLLRRAEGMNYLHQTHPKSTRHLRERNQI